MATYEFHSTLLMKICFSVFFASQDSPVGFALYGIGPAGHIHANNLIRDSQERLKYIVDVDEEKANEFVKSNYLDTKVVPPSAMVIQLPLPW